MRIVARDRSLDRHLEIRDVPIVPDVCSSDLTALDVLIDCLKVEPSKIDNTRQMPTRIGIVMTRLGWRKGRESTGARERYWIRPESWKPGAKPQEAARVEGGGDHVPF